MAEVMFDMIALVFEGVEGFVFDFPSCPSPFDQGDNIALGDVEIGHPAVSISGFSLFRDDMVLEEVDLVCIHGAPLRGTLLTHW